MSNIAETAVPYAILALHDDNIEITEENVQKLLVASNITVQPIWVKIFVQHFENKNIGEFLSSFTSSGSAPVAGGAAPAAAAKPVGGAAPAAAAAKPAAKEESDEEMGMGLFD